MNKKRGIGFLLILVFVFSLYFVSSTDKNYVAYFPGGFNDYITASSDLHPGSAYTIEAWVNPTSHRSFNNEAAPTVARTIISKGNYGEGTEYSFGITYKGELMFTSTAAAEGLVKTCNSVINLNQ